jgi:hypothetical protein
VERKCSYFWHSKVKKKLGECHKFSNFTSDKVMTPKFGLGGGRTTCGFILLCCFVGYLPTSDNVMTPTQLYYYNNLQGCIQLHL